MSQNYYEDAITPAGIGALAIAATAPPICWPRWGESYFMAGKVG